MTGSLSLTKKDVLSLGFSAGALLLSLVAAYFNFFRQVDDVQIRVAEFAIENTHDVRKDQIVTHLAFINRGNRPALVTGAEWLVTLDRIDEGTFGAQSNSPVGTFPFVLEKGELKLVRVTSSRENVQVNSARRNGPLYYGIKIASISSKGTEHGVMLLFATLKMADGTIQDSRYEHLMVPLLGNEDVSFRTAR